MWFDFIVDNLLNLFPVLMMKLFNPLEHYLTFFFLFSLKLEIFVTEATLNEEISENLVYFRELSPKF